MRFLYWIDRHTNIYRALSVLLVMLVLLLTALQINSNIDEERKTPLAEALATYTSALESGTVNSRAMGAAILFGLENHEAKLLATEKLPFDAPEVLSALHNLRTLYFCDVAFLVNRQGIVAAHSMKNSPHATGMDVSTKPYVQLAMRGIPNVYPAISDNVNERGIFLAAPVRSQPDQVSKPVGVAVINVGAEKLDALLNNWGSPAMLLSPQGLVFASNRKDWMFSMTGEVGKKQLDSIRRTHRFGNVFDREQPPSLPFTLHTPETRIDGVRYTVRSHALDWDDPEGEWKLVLLDRLDPWWLRWEVVGFATLFGLIAAMALFWLFTLARNAVLQQKFHREQSIAATTFESQEGILVTDADNVILRVNQSFMDITGYPADEVIGKGTAMFSSGRHGADFYAAMWNRINTLGGWEGDIWNRRKNGEIYPAHLTITAVRGQDGALTNYVATYSDITARVDAETKLLNSMQKLEEKEKAKTRFLAAAGHDLRQPIAAATLYLEALKFTSLNQQQSELAGRIDQSMRIFSSLLSRLLDISKLDSGLVKPQIGKYDLADLFDWLEHNFDQPAQNKQLHLRLYFPIKKSLAVYTDIAMVQSVLMNLVTNAIKYTPHGSILVSARQRGNKVLMQVWDTGIGITEANIPHIFDEFYQVANPQRNREAGLGLGLSICQRTLSLLGGEITCRSLIGRGTVFEFTLPLDNGQHEVSRLPGNHSNHDETFDEIWARGKRIVIIEDDELVAAGMVKLLSGLGAEVLHFRSAEDALRHAGIVEADYFIADYALGSGLNGIQFLETVQQKHSTPICAVILTGDTSTQFISSVADCPWPVLHKPVNYAKLASSLNR